VGSSEPIAKLKQQIAQAAPTNGWVLITGENGTGKELVARQIHLQSRRAAEPFVEVNCAAIPEELIESELFGHEKGAFTGAIARKLGKFEMAHHGTLFLDEIADMSLKTQAKVLRVLQESKFERVGGTEPIEVDVRVIAATNKDLEKEIAGGAFREDLYYRLAVLPFHVPPLRERREDIPLLVDHFTAHFCREYNRRPKQWSPGAIEQLHRHRWPGNVRDLKNVVERAVIMELEDTIDRVAIAGAPGAAAGAESLLDAPTLAEFQQASEIAYLRHHLDRHGWNVAATARAIDTPRSNLYKKLQAYGISREDT